MFWSMDPDENLEELLDLAENIQTDAAQDKAIDQAAAARMAELVLALDGWLTNGGFRPHRWWDARR